ncbi:hypothetical protein FNF27_06120 [Cafeteria roenbergensis]|uniref:Uncharacterized protein n=2 Tax=Cafeteria roenbergensis TaxID=33653 RepID=A0A5A8E2Q1_CAFRO|nr:hypothetical protein FNF27_06120 [Cafeteria roenbergensis]
MNRTPTKSRFASAAASTDRGDFKDPFEGLPPVSTVDPMLSMTRPAFAHAHRDVWSSGSKIILSSFQAPAGHDRSGPAAASGAASHAPGQHASPGRAGRPRAALAPPVSPVTSGPPAAGRAPFSSPPPAASSARAARGSSSARGAAGIALSARRQGRAGALTPARDAPSGPGQAPNSARSAASSTDTFRLDIVDEVSDADRRATERRHHDDALVKRYLAAKRARDGVAQRDRAERAELYANTRDAVKWRAIFQLHCHLTTLSDPGLDPTKPLLDEPQRKAADARHRRAEAELRRKERRRLRRQRMQARRAELIRKQQLRLRAAMAAAAAAASSPPPGASSSSSSSPSRLPSSAESATASALSSGQASPGGGQGREQQAPSGSRGVAAAAVAAALKEERDLQRQMRDSEDGAAGETDSSDDATEVADENFAAVMRAAKAPAGATQSDAAMRAAVMPGPAGAGIPGAYLRPLFAALYKQNPGSSMSQSRFVTTTRGLLLKWAVEAVNKRRAAELAEQARDQAVRQSRLDKAAEAGRRRRMAAAARAAAAAATAAAGSAGGDGGPGTASNGGSRLLGAGIADWDPADGSMPSASTTLVASLRPAWGEDRDQLTGQGAHRRAATADDGDSSSQWGLSPAQAEARRKVAKRFRPAAASGLASPLRRGFGTVSGTLSGPGRQGIARFGGEFAAVAAVDHRDPRKLARMTFAARQAMEQLGGGGGDSDGGGGQELIPAPTPLTMRARNRRQSQVVTRGSAKSTSEFATAVAEGRVDASGVPGPAASGPRAGTGAAVVLPGLGAVRAREAREGDVRRLKWHGVPRGPGGAEIVSKASGSVGPGAGSVVTSLSRGGRAGGRSGKSGGPVRPLWHEGAGESHWPGLTGREDGLVYATAGPADADEEEPADGDKAAGASGGGGGGGGGARGNKAAAAAAAEDGPPVDTDEAKRERAKAELAAAAGLGLQQEDLAVVRFTGVPRWPRIRPPAYATITCPARTIIDVVGALVASADRRVEIEDLVMELQSLAFLPPPEPEQLAFVVEEAEDHDRAVAAQEKAERAAIRRAEAIARKAAASRQRDAWQWSDRLYRFLPRRPAPPQWYRNDSAGDADRAAEVARLADARAAESQVFAQRLGVGGTRPAAVRAEQTRLFLEALQRDAALAAGGRSAASSRRSSGVDGAPGPAAAASADGGSAVTVTRKRRSRRAGAGAGAGSGLDSLAVLGDGSDEEEAGGGAGGAAARGKRSMITMYRLLEDSLNKGSANWGVEAEASIAAALASDTDVVAVRRLPKLVLSLPNLAIEEPDKKARQAILARDGEAGLLQRSREQLMRRSKYGRLLFQLLGEVVSDDPDHPSGVSLVQKRPGGKPGLQPRGSVTLRAFDSLLLAPPLFKLLRPRNSFELRTEAPACEFEELYDPVIRTYIVQCRDTFRKAMAVRRVVRRWTCLRLNSVVESWMLYVARRRHTRFRLARLTSVLLFVQRREAFRKWRRLATTDAAAERFQNLWRRKRAIAMVRELMPRVAAAKRIQSTWRMFWFGHRLRRQALAQRTKAATDIQRVFRGRRGRAAVRRMVQSRFRQEMAKIRKERKRLQSLREAAMARRIQRMARGRIRRNRARELRVMLWAKRRQEEEFDAFEKRQELERRIAEAQEAERVAAELAAARAKDLAEEEAEASRRFMRIQRFQREKRTALQARRQDLLDLDAECARRTRVAKEKFAQGREEAEKARTNQLVKLLRDLAFEKPHLSEAVSYLDDSPETVPGAPTGGVGWRNFSAGAHEAAAAAAAAAAGDKSAAAGSAAFTAEEIREQAEIAARVEAIAKEELERIQEAIRSGVSNRRSKSHECDAYVAAISKVVTDEVAKVAAETADSEQRAMDEVAAFRRAERKRIEARLARRMLPTEQEAAGMLQLAWRARRARDALAAAVRSGYTKRWDETRVCFVYVNKLSGTSHTRRPAVFGPYDIRAEGLGRDEEAELQVRARAAHGPDGGPVGGADGALGVGAFADETAAAAAAAAAKGIVGDMLPEEDLLEARRAQAEAAAAQAAEEEQQAGRAAAAAAAAAASHDGYGHAVPGYEGWGDPAADGGWGDAAAAGEGWGDPAAATGQWGTADQGGAGYGGAGGWDDAAADAAGTAGSGWAPGSGGEVWWQDDGQGGGYYTDGLGYWDEAGAYLLFDVDAAQ